MIRRSIKIVVARVLCATALASYLALPSEAARIKDIASFEGVRENRISGLGIVSGLGGTGDNLNSSPFTQQLLASLMDRYGVNISGEPMRAKNVAAVTVTATLPPFPRRGSRIDVTVQAVGDAKSLLGGVLQQTWLVGPDGRPYAMAQGPIAVSGFGVQGQAAKMTVGVQTVGRIPGGAIIEAELSEGTPDNPIPYEMSSLETLRLALMNPDASTAVGIANVVNRAVGGTGARAQALDPTTVEILPGNSWKDRMVELMARVENLDVVADTAARVVVDDRTGTIVMGERVRISTVAVSHGNLTIKVVETPQVSQPNPLSEGATVVVPRTDIQVDTAADKRLAVLPAGSTLQDVVKGLNTLGVSPRDMISILQAIKTAGALQADLVIQ
ncbi:flagellar basal body P-ring protein FlgI [Azospirillum sp. SYSU D00513]|uniref:flagellar basal body P-ring protein FlgI n=1 Tax=Azospirillum sp. SYSU D00513 TaxID=2812561 RepID=UPI001A95FD6A|nr:flagellar basal body P-ring protein FlgI [Azospirillum sp. SYSU D00513]